FYHSGTTARATPFPYTTLFRSPDEHVDPPGGLDVAGKLADAVVAVLEVVRRLLRGLGELVDAVRQVVEGDVDRRPHGERGDEQGDDDRRQAGDALVEPVDDGVDHHRDDRRGRRPRQRRVGRDEDAPGGEGGDGDEDRRDRGARGDPYHADGRSRRRCGHGRVPYRAGTGRRSPTVGPWATRQTRRPPRSRSTVPRPRPGRLLARPSAPGPPTAAVGSSSRSTLGRWSWWRASPSPRPR